MADGTCPLRYRIEVAARTMQYCSVTSRNRIDKMQIVIGFRDGQNMVRCPYRVRGAANLEGMIIPVFG